MKFVFLSGLRNFAHMADVGYTFAPNASDYNNYEAALITATQYRVQDSYISALLNKVTRNRRVLSVQELTDVGQSVGIATANFQRVMSSFSVNSKLRKNKADFATFGHCNTVCLLVNGNYWIQDPVNIHPGDLNALLQQLCNNR